MAAIHSLVYWQLHSSIAGFSSRPQAAHVQVCYTYFSAETFLTSCYLGCTQLCVYSATLVVLYPVGNHLHVRTGLL